MRSARRTSSTSSSGRFSRSTESSRRYSHGGTRSTHRGYSRGTRGVLEECRKQPQVSTRVGAPVSILVGTGSARRSPAQRTALRRAAAVGKAIAVNPPNASEDSLAAGTAALPQPPSLALNDSSCSDRACARRAGLAEDLQGCAARNRPRRPRRHHHILQRGLRRNAPPPAAAAPQPARNRRCPATSTIAAGRSSGMT